MDISYIFLTIFLEQTITPMIDVCQLFMNNRTKNRALTSSPFVLTLSYFLTLLPQRQVYTNKAYYTLIFLLGLGEKGNCAKVIYLNNQVFRYPITITKSTIFDKPYTSTM